MSMTKKLKILFRLFLKKIIFIILDTCPGDKDILVFKSSGYRLRHKNLTTTLSKTLKKQTDEKENYFQKTSSETECIFSCLVNLVFL